MNRNKYACVQLGDPTIYGAKIEAQIYEMMHLEYMDDSLIISLKIVLKVMHKIYGMHKMMMVIKVRI